MSSIWHNFWQHIIKKLPVLELIYTLVIWVLMLIGFTYEPPVTAEATNYIDRYKELAIVEMHRTGVPASITMAQAIHESNIGKSSLATLANNHFGIKCKKHWKGSTYYHKDDDLNDRGQLIESCFRSYGNAIDSYVDHSNFLKYGSNYMQLFFLDRDDYKGWAYGLKRAGYATDVRYAEKLIYNIEKYGLAELDQMEDPLKRYK